MSDLAKWYLALPPEVQGLPPVVDIAHLSDEELPALIACRAKACLAGRSPNLVSDAVVFAVFARDYDMLLRALERAQGRCTELLNENRELRAR